MQQMQQAQVNAGMFGAGHAVWMRHFNGQLGQAHAAINVNGEGRFTGLTFGNPGADAFACIGERGSVAAYVELTSTQGDRTQGSLNRHSDVAPNFVVHGLTALDQTSKGFAASDWLSSAAFQTVDGFPGRSESDIMMLSDFRPRGLTAVIGGGVIATKIPNIGLVLTAATRGAFSTGNYFARDAMPYRMGPGRRFSVSGAEYLESNGWFTKTSW